MHSERTIQKLSDNREVFKSLLADIKPEEYLWKSAPGKWSLLEIVCHLYDEEREDFRARVEHVLQYPDLPMAPIDPVEWVIDRHYASQDFTTMREKFLEERAKSVQWLQSLKNPVWDNAYQHPVLGEMTAYLFLSNWLAHDYLHIRQIIRVKYEYLNERAGEPLNYAGVW